MKMMNNLKNVRYSQTFISKIIKEDLEKCLNLA